MKTDWSLPYPSRRSPVLAQNVVATSQPLAAQAGLRMLLAGGNAVDAALATAIALAVVEPNNNGIGSDAFALVWDGKRLHGLNASGRSPAGWTPERFAGRDQMPPFGWDSVTVPGAVSAWAALSGRFGALPFARLFEPAIHYAREGFPVGPISAFYWKFGEGAYGDYPDFAAHFLAHGHAPRPGERFVCRDTAKTLETIADSGGEAFYRGELAERIVACSEAAGGAMTAADLAGHRAQWVAPISQPYRAVELHEIPPNGQGLTLCSADASGMMVSFIQSNYLAFGSGIVVPGTGIHLQNRGLGFSLEPGHPNRVGPSKRPFHTIIPGFLTRDGQADMAFGVMGGHMQAQGHVQMTVRREDYAQNPQAACDAPRWHVREDGALLLEPGFDASVVEELSRRGHRIVQDAPPHVFGGAQLISRLQGGYCGASDHRKEGHAVGF